MLQDYPNAPPILVAVDCIIFGFDQNELKILLTRRALKPEIGRWSLIGGFIRMDESLDDAAQRLLQQLTGLKNIYMEEVKSFSKIDRDPVERAISISYYALIKTKKRQYLIKDYGAEWVSLKEMPDLIFNHIVVVKN